MIASVIVQTPNHSAGPVQEHKEISTSHPDILARMFAVLVAENKTIYDPGPAIPDDPRYCSCTHAD